MPELIKNSIYETEITGYTAESAGVCRVNGQVVFVPGAIRGELCKIKILKVGKNAAYGKIEEVLKASPHRITVDCPVYGKCGGCTMLHLDYEEELWFKRHKVEDALKRIGGIDRKLEEILGAESRENYRNKVIFAVGSGENGPIVGFFRNRSHDVVPAANCQVQVPYAAQAAEAVTQWMREENILPYDWKTGSGMIRHVFCRYGFQTHQLQVVLISASHNVPRIDEFVSKIRALCPPVRSIQLNVNTSRGNTVLSGTFETLWGDDKIEDRLCGYRFALSARSFYQVNRNQAERLYQKAVEYAGLTGKETVLDLYCGTGTITLCMARKAKWVWGAEIVPEAIFDAKQNAAENKVLNAEFFCADANEAAERMQRDGVRPNVIVVDPPRKGLAPEVVETTVKMQPERIVYVSCDPATLARDVKKFEQLNYTVKRAAAVDMFPGTYHVESVVLMSRA